MQIPLSFLFSLILFCHLKQQKLLTVASMLKCGLRWVVESNHVVSNQSEFNQYSFSKQDIWKRAMFNCHIYHLSGFSAVNNNFAWVHDFLLLLFYSNPPPPTSSIFFLFYFSFKNLQIQIQNLTFDCLCVFLTFIMALIF